MNVKRFQQLFFYRFLEGAFFVFLVALKLFPAELFRRLWAPLLSLLIFCLVPRRRVLRNLTAAFGESYSSATKKGVAKGVQEHFVKNLLDCFLQLRDPEHVRQNITIEGLENLDGGLAKGKGVIALGAHIGNFVLVGTRLGAEGYPFSTLFRLPSDERIKGIIERHLPSFYQRIIPSQPRRLAVRRIFATLKRNEIVFILADNLKKGKLHTFLFGQRVRSSRGPVSLALRSGAPVIPMYLIRNYHGGLQLVIKPEIPLIRNGNVYKDIIDNTHGIVGYMEALISRYPDQWNWLTVRMHKQLQDVSLSR